jgi:type II secretory pathway pseudopilin PulG
MVEILVALVIISILAAMLVVGMRRLNESSKTRAARVTLNNAKSMLAEYERKNKLTGFSGSIAAPGDVNEDAATGARNGPQVSFTRSFFALLTAMPENKAALAQLSSDQIMAGGPPPSTPTATNWAAGSSYVAFQNRVHHPTSSSPVYICIRDHSSTTADAPGQPNAPWIVENTTTPILLDAWNNPIIFVPPGGLEGVWTKETLTTPNPVRAPNNRPFFASAGPDGIFGRMPGPDGVFGRTAGTDGVLGTPDDVTDDINGGDDNLYSFEN